MYGHPSAMAGFPVVKVYAIRLAQVKSELFDCVYWKEERARIQKRNGVGFMRSACLSLSHRVFS